MIVFVDVDDTLVRTAGSQRIPRLRVIERVKALHAEGNTLCLWNAGGADYAQATASALGIVNCFAGFLPKPNLIIDDMPVSEQPSCVNEDPD